MNVAEIANQEALTATAIAVPGGTAATRQADVRSFAKGVGTIMAYRLAGQAILLGSTLFAARIMSPTAFASVGLFSSIISLVSMASSLRLETLAIVARGPARPKYIALAHVVNLSVLAAGLVVVIGLRVAGWYPAGAGDWVLLIPVGIYLSSLTQFVLPAQFSDVADATRVGRLTQGVSISTGVLQAGLPLLWHAAASLLWARVLGMAIGLVTVRGKLVEGLGDMRTLRRRDMRRLLPVATGEMVNGVPASLLSVFSFQVPVYVYTALGHTASVGSYWMAFNLMFVPFMILQASFRPLFLRKIAAARSPASSYDVLAKWSLALTGLGIGVAACFAIGAEFVIVPLIGAKWAEAAQNCVWMSVLLAALAAQLPASSASSALGLQRLNLAANILYLAIRAGAIAWALISGFGPAATVAIFSTAGAIGYFGQVVVTLAILRRRRGRA